ncbi:MAG TPA: hypothetical protein VL996_02625 [Methylocella sp.]|nr:hypothetical protein [Methylocella sp.]
MKKLSGHHDLRQGQGIDKSKSLMVNEVLFIQNERFMKGKQTQQNPEIDKYPEEFSGLIDGARFQAVQPVVHHVWPALRHGSRSTTDPVRRLRAFPTEAPLPLRGSGRRPAAVICIAKVVITVLIAVVHSMEKALGKKHLPVNFWRFAAVRKSRGSPRFEIPPAWHQ